MDGEVERERLLSLMRRRHDLAVLALESPAGFGRTVLIRHALRSPSSSPASIDICVECDWDDGRPGALTSLLMTALDPTDGQAMDETVAPVEMAVAGARRVADALAVLSSGGTEVALVVDNVERSGEEGAAVLTELMERLPLRGHLVLSGRRLPRAGLARHVAAGNAILIDQRDLAFRPDEVTRLARARSVPARGDLELLGWPALASLVLQDQADLVCDYVRGTVLRGTDESVAEAVAALVAVDGCTDDALTGILSAALHGSGGQEDPVGLRELVETVRALPLMEVGGGIWPHPLWAEITEGVLSAASHDRVIVAKVKAQIAAGTIHEAGEQAVAGGSAEALRLVVRSALGTLPPRGTMADLLAWWSSDVLDRAAVEHQWLQTVLDLHHEDPGGRGRLRLEQVRRQFERAGDEDGEIAVLLHLGSLARAYADSGLLASVLERGKVIAANGNPVVQALLAIGNAVFAQLHGDFDASIEVLERIPAGTLSGEWASQALMVRGANLMLAGRTREAVEALHSATGEGSLATRSVGHDLLSVARWHDRDVVGAIEDAETAETLARRAGTLRAAQLHGAWKACILAAAAQREPADLELARLRSANADGAEGGEGQVEEFGTLLRIAEALRLADDGELEAARTLVQSTPVLPRAARSSVWKLALGTAFSDGADVPFEDVHGYPSRQALNAGRAAAAHLAGGPLASGIHRPFLPGRWCKPDGGAVALRLSGAARVERNGKPVVHPAWRRTRVRELCLHLALVANADRSMVAAALWPDRPDRAGALNLRVTLNLLLEVIEPERGKAAPSLLIVDGDTSLAFGHVSQLRIDLWDMDGSALAVLELPDHERPAVLAHARRMVAVGWGPLLGSQAIGEWAEPHRRDRAQRTLAAALRAGHMALAAADHELAEALGALALEVDPWAEAAHALIVEARLANGNADGARSSLLDAFNTFDELGITPSVRFGRLSHRLGLYRRR